MRRLLVWVLAIGVMQGFGSKRSAAEPDLQAPSQSPRDPRAQADARYLLQVQYLDEQIDGAHTRRTIGVVLTLFGAAATATGVGLATAAFSKTTSSSGYKGGALAVVAAGAAGLGLGIPLWISGNRRIGRYQDEKARLLFGYSPILNAPTVQLVARF